MFRQVTSRSIRAARPSLSAHKAATPRAIFLRNIHGSVPGRKEEEPLPPSFVEKYQLNLPSRWVPLTVGGFGAATATGLYHWDPESQMLGLFVLFVGTVYSQGGTAIGKVFDNISDAILKEHQAVEDAQINAVQVTLDAHKRHIGIYEDIKSIFEVQKELMDDIVDLTGKQLQHEFRADFVNKLDTIVHEEQKATDVLRATLVSNATKFVTEQYTNGKKKDLLKFALGSALSAIPDPENHKDQVGDIYKAYFAHCRKSWADLAGKEIQVDAETLAGARSIMETAAKREGLTVPEYSGKVQF